MADGCFFSLICPAFNCEKTLESSINSIIRQSFFDWEIILVDDDSDDDTAEICDQYASRDKRIKVIHQKKSGQSRARLNGLDIASGEYVLFMDSDDEYSLDALQVIYETLKNKNLKMLVYNASIVQKNAVNKSVYDFDDNNLEIPIVEFFLKRRISYLWSICFKKELFDLPKNVLDKFCSLSYSEDLYLIYNIVKNIDNNDYEIINQQLYKYNYNENSLTKNQNAGKVLDRFYSFNDVYESIFLDNSKAFSRISREVKDTAGWTYLSAARKIALEYDFETYLPLIKQIRSSFIFKHVNNFKKDRYNFVGYILLKLKMYKRFRKYIIKKEGKLNEN